MTLIAFVSFFILHSAFFIPTRALAKPGAALFLDPETDSLVVEEIKTLALKVNTGPDTINAIEATVAYPTHQIEVVSIAKGPLLKIWAQEPVHDSKKGTIRFAGGIPSPGFKGVGSVLVLKVKARTAGDIPLVITTGAVLANDGQGTNVLASLGGGLYRAQPKQILPQIVEEPQKPAVEPGAIKPIPEAQIIPPPIAPPVTSAPFAPAVPFVPSVISEDREPPQPFVVQIFEGARTFCITPTLMFKTVDIGSGLTRYTVSLDNREVGSVDEAQHTGFIKLAALEPGHHTAVVVAYDRAGNTLARSGNFVIEPVPSPDIKSAPRRLKPSDTLQVWGHTIAESALEGTLTKEEGVPVFISILINQEGKWSYTHPDTLAEGRYVLMLAARDRCGAISQPTTVKFRVTSEGYFAPITKSFARAVEATPAFFQPITSSFKTVFSDVADWLGRLFRR